MFYQKISVANKKVKLVSFAQIGLQEHSSTGVGNCTLLINGYNEYKDNSITKKLVEFLKNINYFLNIDFYSKKYSFLYKN